jgi:hypothetical protein
VVVLGVARLGLDVRVVFVVGKLALELAGQGREGGGATAEAAEGVLGDEGVRINEGVSVSLGKGCRTVMYWSLPSSLSRLSRSAAYLARRASVSREAAIAPVFVRPLRTPSAAAGTKCNEFRRPAEKICPPGVCKKRPCVPEPGPLFRGRVRTFLEAF